ncbi:4-hydroxymandelate oxidase [Thermosporothrix hazakensis]|jgi:isopentenyl diphosphate isomerase/L-lactate dehydrogenase-like FMN-dependent dehydrogenase|uniref:4-hydroxymandelate oxidase n=2 Tax=Thermosporothrix TaxID=768650 RepID=A0A326UDR5_THEHA|nr:alpha-hydroxy acid oxidase [Thermosporothrix hazakensis]PZW36567.1 4-hydroxymandelate oxidase [Thermosporothrix hazakensis]BBH89034.1 alpha-hydroxy-acid oxidizing enzyme [Thermosporothrix sp. COM3]GCE47218.1 alpha-hydroxy-acid oxidizing enzyme [Thermosporothrix hazakensis]
MDPINVFDYEKLAREKLDQLAWDYYNGGSDDEVTLRANRSAFERIRIRPRMLVDTKNLDMRTTALGTPISMPVIVAPTAAHSMAHPDAEIATVQATGNCDTIFTASTAASRNVVEIAQAATGPIWFQLYTHRNLDFSRTLVQRAEQAGYRAIVFTVDMPQLGHRERDLRNNFDQLQQLPTANFQLSEGFLNPTERHKIDTWETVDWLKSVTSLPILLKGILTAEDALLALEHHVDGIIVSNHGGRQLDGVMAGIEALPEVVEAVAGRCEVYMDGGIRRGTDILKALALGARAVLVGRPVLWGLAANGAQGVRGVLEILRSELALAMTLAGCPNLASITPSLVKIL